MKMIYTNAIIDTKHYGENETIAIIVRSIRKDKDPDESEIYFRNYGISKWGYAKLIDCNIFNLIHTISMFDITEKHVTLIREKFNELKEIVVEAGVNAVHWQGYKNFIVSDAVNKSVRDIIVETFKDTDILFYCHIDDRASTVLLQQEIDSQGKELNRLLQVTVMDLVDEEFPLKRDQSDENNLHE